MAGPRVPPAGRVPPGLPLGVSWVKLPEECGGAELLTGFIW